VGKPPIAVTHDAVLINGKLAVFVWEHSLFIVRGGTEEPSVMLSAHLIFHEQLLGGVAPHTPPTIV
jgi:hypothetical protein